MSSCLKDVQFIGIHEYMDEYMMPYHCYCHYSMRGSTTSEYYIGILHMEYYTEEWLAFYKTVLDCQVFVLTESSLLQRKNKAPEQK